MPRRTRHSSADRGDQAAQNPRIGLTSGPGAGPARGSPPARGPGAKPPRFGLSGRGWLLWLVGLLIFNVVFYGPHLEGTKTAPTVDLPYSAFLIQAKAGNIKTADVSTATVDGAFQTPYKDPAKGKPS